MAQFKFVMWLAYWYQQTVRFEFEWDAGNRLKNIKKHGVRQLEVESVFLRKLAVPIGAQVAPEVVEERVCIVGPTETGRMLSVVFTLREGRVRPISVRPASKKERGLYEQIGEALKNV